MPNLRALIAEDDFQIADNLFTYLTMKGFTCEAVYSGQAALHRCSVDRFDVILLDIGLPGVDGLGVLHRLRTDLRVATPVLVISARSDLSDKLAGFEHGADDYLVKPFALAEVEARVHALLKRAHGSITIDTVRRLGALAFDAHEGEAWVDDKPLHLTPKAAALLALLLQNAGRLVRRVDIERALWPDSVPQSDVLRSQVHWLRRALETAGFDGLETVHGVGYRLVDSKAAP